MAKAGFGEFAHYLKINPTHYRDDGEPVKEYFQAAARVPQCKEFIFAWPREAPGEVIWRTYDLVRNSLPDRIIRHGRRLWNIRAPWEPENEPLSKWKYADALSQIGYEADFLGIIRTIVDAEPNDHPKVGWLQGEKGARGLPLRMFTEVRDAAAAALEIAAQVDCVYPGWSRFETSYANAMRILGARRILDAHGAQPGKTDLLPDDAETWTVNARAEAIPEENVISAADYVAFDRSKAHAVYPSLRPGAQSWIVYTTFTHGAAFLNRLADCLAEIPKPKAGKRPGRTPATRPRGIDR